MKRFFDVVISLFALLLVAPISLLIAILIKLDSRGTVLARPHRVGRNGRMVKVFEFRTAVSEPDAMETVAGCHGEAVTGIGALLRRLGMARWPLLINVLRGDLSIVGPKAELPRYVGCYPTAIRKLVLSVKPGLIDLTSVNFYDEREMLAGLDGVELEEAYVEKVLPLKLEYAQQYMAECGFWFDLRLFVRYVSQSIRIGRG